MLAVWLATYYSIEAHSNSFLQTVEAYSIILYILRLQSIQCCTISYKATVVTLILIWPRVSVVSVFIS